MKFLNEKIYHILTSLTFCLNKCYVFAIVFFFQLLFLNSCNFFHKNVEPTLPPITMEGKNTFGCLVNGKVWLPKGDLFVPSVNADYTSGKFLVLGASIRSSSYSSSFSFLIFDPILNNKTYILKDTSIARAVFYERISNNNSCSYENYQVFDGSLTITKFDTRKNIVSGTFQFSTYNPSCGDTIKVTQGRFDIGNIVQ